MDIARTNGAFTIGPVHVGQGTVIATGLFLGVLTVVIYRRKTRHRRYKSGELS
jgi:hypothetical protein